VAECVLKLDRAIACDLAEDVAATSRFVLVEDFEIRGGGIVREALPDRQTAARDRVLLRNYKWEPSIIPPERRAEKYNQKATLILITGEHELDRKGLAKALEGKLFEDGRVVYFLGIGNVLYGVDADIERKQENRQEHIRRLGEVANLMLDAGIILVVTAAELTQDDLEVIKTAVQPDAIETVWAGDNVTTDLVYDLQLSGGTPAESADRLKAHLQDKGIIFRPW
jgi:bifunctional enzyme CysN/CysC